MGCRAQAFRNSVGCSRLEVCSLSPWGKMSPCAFQRGSSQSSHTWSLGLCKAQYYEKLGSFLFFCSPSQKCVGDIDLCPRCLLRSSGCPERHPFLSSWGRGGPRGFGETRWTSTVNSKLVIIYPRLYEEAEQVRKLHYLHVFLQFLPSGSCLCPDFPQ